MEWEVIVGAPLIKPISPRSGNSRASVNSSTAGMVRDSGWRLRGTNVDSTVPVCQSEPVVNTIVNMFDGV